MGQPVPCTAPGMASPKRVARAVQTNMPQDGGDVGQCIQIGLLLAAKMRKCTARLQKRNHTVTWKSIAQPEGENPALTSSNNTKTGANVLYKHHPEGRGRQKSVISHDCILVMGGGDTPKVNVNGLTYRASLSLETEVHGRYAHPAVPRHPVSHHEQQARTLRLSRERMKKKDGIKETKTLVHFTQHAHRASGCTIQLGEVHTRRLSRRLQSRTATAQQTPGH